MGITEGGTIRLHHRRNFPSGMIGLGLFLLRLITALTLARSGYSLLYESATGWGLTPWAGGALSFLSVLLVVGFVTTAAGIAACGLVVSSLLWLGLPLTANSGIALGLTLVSMLLGPGSYSIDARLFGWRRVEITRRPGINED
jgi:hypothetical protein